LVFIDETWVKTNMIKMYGRSKSGTRLLAYAPHGHRKTLTFIGALRNDGIVAPCVFDQPINGVSFLVWVKESLVPALKPRDLVIMDNLSSHKVEGVRNAIKETGAKVLYLPPYSPDLNPIEQVFAKVKSLLRKAEKRTIDEVTNHIGALIETIKPDECLNYFKNSGYAYN
jgi:transposase